MNAKNHFFAFVLFLFLFIPATDNSLIAGCKADLGMDAVEPDYQENYKAPNFRIGSVARSPSVIINKDTGVTTRMTSGL